MNRFGKTLTIGAVCGLGVLSACDERTLPGGIEVDDVWVRAVSLTEEGPKNTAAYLRVVNASDSPDRLLEARSDIARMTEIHRTTIDDAGLARMGPAGSVEIRPGETIVLEPGGLHVMLMGMTKSLAEGEDVSLTLVFEVAGEVEVVAEVRPF